MSIPNNFEQHWELRRPRAWQQPSGNSADPYRSLHTSVSDRSLPGGTGVIVANGFVNPAGDSYFTDFLQVMANHGMKDLIAHVWTGIKGYTGGITAQEFYTSAFYSALNNTIRTNLDTHIVPKVRSGDINFEIYIGAIIPDQRNPLDWGVTGSIDNTFPQELHYFGNPPQSHTDIYKQDITADRQWFVSSLSGSYARGIWLDAMGSTAELNLIEATMAPYIGPIREESPGGNPGDRYFIGGEGLPLIFLPGTYLGYPGGKKSIINTNLVGRIPFITLLFIKRLFDPQMTWEVDYTTTAYHIIIQHANQTGNATFPYPSFPTHEEIQRYHDQGFCIGCSLDLPSETIDFIMELAERDRQRLLDFYNYRDRIDAAESRPSGGGSSRTTSGKVVARDGKLYTEEQIRVLKNLYDV